MSQSVFFNHDFLATPNSLLNAAAPVSQAIHNARFRIVLDVFETRVVSKEVHLKGKEGERKFDVPKSTKSLNFKLQHVNQRKWMKGMPIPHLAKESTGAEASLLSKPTVTIDQK